MKSNIFFIRPKGLNIGNDVIFFATRYFLEKALGYSPNIITIPATSKYETTSRAGLTASTIYEINQYGSGVIIGGGNLYENNEIDVDTNALKALEVPLFLFSLSRGRIYNRDGRLVNRTDCMPDNRILELNRAAYLSSARDKATLTHLEKAGCEDVKLSACPTLFLDKVTAGLPELSERQKNLTLVSVRNPSLINVPLETQAKVRNDVREILSFLQSEGHDPVLLCHDQRDIPFAASFTGIEYLYLEEAATYLAVLKAARLNVSYRLHAALPCLVYGTPVIKISYDERGLSLMDTAGYGEWNINMMEVPGVRDAVASRYARLSELPALKKRTEGLWAEYHATISGQFESFVKRIEGKG